MGGRKGAQEKDEAQQQAQDLFHGAPFWRGLAARDEYQESGKQKPGHAGQAGV
ncbi:MAG: hypothetical protein GX171_04580 [Clostridiales bacterium]|jgi:hypothetical protein|nr:hypothetical protein [Clostridiales bacterium]